MSSTIAYLTSRANFVQVSPEIPITKARNPEKIDAPEVFEGESNECFAEGVYSCLSWTANRRELVADLMVKAKQVEYLIQSLPEPEAEQQQVRRPLR